MKCSHLSLNRNIRSCLKDSYEFDKPYSSTIEFVNQLKKGINEVNMAARAEQRWGDIIYDHYASALTRASARGAVAENEILLFILIYLVGGIGALMFILPQVKLTGPSGIRHNHIFHNALTIAAGLGCCQAHCLSSSTYCSTSFLLTSPTGSLSSIRFKNC